VVAKKRVFPSFLFPTGRRNRASPLISDFQRRQAAAVKTTDVNIVTWSLHTLQLHTRSGSGAVGRGTCGARGQLTRVKPLRSKVIRPRVYGIQRGAAAGGEAGRVGRLGALLEVGVVLTANESRLHFCSKGCGGYFFRA
jgi:hypothetical protein